MYTQFTNVAAGSGLEAHGIHAATSVNNRTLKASCAFTKVQDGAGDDDDNKWQKRIAVCRNMLMK